MLTRTINTSVCRDKLYQLRDALISKGQPADAATLVLQESRLFARQMVVTTPPYGLGGATKAKGETAVKKDLQQIFTGVEEETLNTEGSNHGVTNIDAWMTTPSGNQLHFKWDKIDPTGQGMKVFHYRAKGRNGRTRNLKKSSFDGWYAAYVVSKADLAAYRAKILARVGRRKASWGVAWMQLGGKLQKWIKRHIEGGGAKGQCIENLTGTNNPHIIISSQAPGILGDSHIVASALRIRKDAITRHIKGVLSGYAQDWKDGLRIRRQVKSEPAGEL